MIIPFYHVKTDSPPESRLPPDPPYPEEGGMPVAGGATFQGSGGSIDNSNLVTSFKGKMKLVSSATS